MDDLDRLYHRLVLSVRDGSPHLLDRQFRLGDVAAHLVPYRHTRRELGFDSIQQYETALLRLASGERGYLRAESHLQESLRQALAGPQPDASLLRTHGEATVALPPDALARAGLTSSTVPALTATGAASSPPPPPARPATGEMATVPAAADLERAVVASSQAADAWSEMARRTPPSPPPPIPPPPAPAAQTAPSDTPTPTRHPTTGTGAGCRYCGQPLPEGRRITFCPYCGNNVTVLQCPACSTELEVGWRFCITCGRTMDEATFGDPPGPRGVTETSPDSAGTS